MNRNDDWTVCVNRGSLRGIRRRDLAVRFAFGAAVSVVAGQVGLALGDRPGGVLLAFPAILPAALTLIESKEGVSAAVSDVRGAVVGALGMLAFALVVVTLAGRVPALVELVAATVAWGAVSAALYVARISLARALSAQHHPSDVVVSEATHPADAQHEVIATRRGERH